MASAIMALITTSLPALERELHLLTVRYREDRLRLEKQMALYRRLKKDIAAARLDEDRDGPSVRELEFIIKMHFASLDSQRQQARAFREEIDRLSGELVEATTSGPLTPEQARKRADRDTDRRQRISDIQAGKNRQIAAV